MKTSPAESNPSQNRPDRKWFLLALCFFLLNGWAVIKLTCCQNGPAQPESPAGAVSNAPLRLVSVSLGAYDTRNRYAVLRLEFNGAVASSQVGRFLAVAREGAPARESVMAEVVGDIRSRTVLVKVLEVVPGDTLRVTVSKGLAAVAGAQALLVDQTGRIEVTNGFEPRSLEAECPAFEPASVMVHFGKRVDPAAAESLVAVDPPVKVELEPTYGGCRLTGPFLPGRGYAITFRKGLKAEDGTVLDHDVTRQVVFGDCEPSLAFPNDGTYLSPRGTLNVPVSAVNIRECTVVLRRICPVNVVHCANRQDRYDDRRHEGLTEPAVSNSVALPDRPNRENRFTVKLREVAGAEPRGVYHLSVQYKDPSSVYDRDRETSRLVVVTDLGLSVKRAKEGVWAWVNSLQSALPATNTEVVVYARNNQELARGRTDSQGLVFLPLPRQTAPELEPTLVTASQGDDNSYLALTDPVELEGSGGEACVEGVPEAFVFTDRGVYRPGETFHAKALVRDAGMNPPAPFPVLFRVVRPDGKVYRDVPAMLDALGSVECSLELPAYLPTGAYPIRLVMPGTFTELGVATVALEDFVPPQVAITLSNLPARVASSASFPLDLSARHLFGRPAAGLPVSAEATFEDLPFKPAGWEGYVFGDREKAAIRKDQPLGQTRLDEGGSASFTVAGLESFRPASAIKATVCATVSDSGGRPVSAYASTVVDAYPFYIGVKPDREGGHVKVGEAVRLALATVNPDGSPSCAVTSLVATVEHVQWISMMKRREGHYTWQSERAKTRVGAPAGVSVVKGAAAFTFTPDRAGETVVTFADPASGASSSVIFFSAAGDSQWVDWARDKPAAVTLTLDRPSYAPGDTARLAVKAPFTGPALLTIESDRVLEHRLVNLTANTAEFEIGVKPGFAPNVHCVLSLIRPATAESVWSAHRAVGAVALKVVPPGHGMKVAIETPQAIRPQSRLPVTVKVCDEAGVPVADASVVVMAVDEGICLLTELGTPDPLAFFLRPRGLAVTLYDLYSELMAVCEDTADDTVSHTGGGGGELLGRRLNPIKASRFKPVSLWASGLVTDRHGVVATTLEVPEFTGELRVTAVAFGRSVFGAAREPVTVKRPLVVQAGLPRFLAPGDTCRMSLAIFNETGADISAEWKATCDGPLTVSVPGGVAPLKTGAQVTVPVSITAGSLPGVAHCRVAVSAGNERYDETFELAVRPVLAAESRLVFGQVKPGAEATIAAPEEWLAGTGFYDVWVSGAPDVQLGGTLEWLLRYPYGCCEQTTSAAFPLLYLGDLAARVRPGGLGDVDTPQWIAAGVIRLLAMQRESGGFAMWPDSRREEPWAALYATHFLVEAKKAGIQIPEDRLVAALDYLREQLPKAGQAGSIEPAERAYVCQVLAQAGRPERGWTARLLEGAGELPVSARAHLAAALLADGKPREALTLLNNTGLPEEADGSGGRTGDLALLLSAWLDCDPAHEQVRRLVHDLEGLRRARQGGWGTTHENALAAMALGKFSKLTTPDKTPFSGELRPAGAPPVAFTSAREARWVSKCPGASRDLKIANRGPGACWYGARVEGVPVAGEFKPVDQGLMVRREWFNQKGEKLSDATLNQGDLLVVKLTLDTRGESLDNLVIEDLLPAGWEIENPDLATSRILSWVSADTDWCLHRELRDDRVLLFTGTVSGKAEYFYTVRAVTPGHFTLPPVRAEAMYHPDLLSVQGGGVVDVRE